MWGNYGMGLWGWAFGGLILVGVVVLVVVVVRLSSNVRPQSAAPATGTRDSRSRPPKEILDERYAKGELTSEEYRERLTTLGLRP